MADRRVICSCAVTGGMSVPGQSSAIPVTPEEIIDSAVAAHAAGAAIVHIHVREPSTGRPVSDLELFEAVLGGIGDRLAELFREAGTKPEYETYDVGHLYNLRHLADQGLVDFPLHVQFVLGVLGANAASLEQLLHMHRTATALFPEGFTWSAAGVGYPGQFQLVATSSMLGGHIRVGLEDNLRTTLTQRAGSNAELVEKAMTLATLLDREPASAAGARELLGLEAR